MAMAKKFLLGIYAAVSVVALLASAEQPQLTGIIISLGAATDAMVEEFPSNRIIAAPPHVIGRQITFKQFIFDSVYAKAEIKDKKISLISCDLDGAEEDIFEDLLYFSNYNKCAVRVRFNIGQWKSKTIADVAYLFPFFTTDCAGIDPETYLQENPSASMAFFPRDDAPGQLIKKNMPVVIIGYNLVTYISNMVAQMERYTNDIIVVDNNSSFQPLLDYYEHEYKYTLLRLNKNFGHKVYQQDFVERLVGDVYILTDPDLEFNKNLPDDFINNFLAISTHFEAGRVGFALSIEGDNLRSETFSLKCSRKPLTIKECEAVFWKNRLIYPQDTNLEMYEATIDTTFCLINRKNLPKKQIRVAGDYTCLHLPWYINFKARLQPGEYEAYKQKNISTNYCK